MKFYIDPGTGSMLFTILIGVIGASIYSVRMLMMKLRQKLGGGKVEISDTQVPFVIFSDDKRYWNVFGPICRELEAMGKEVVYLTGSEDDPALTCSYRNVKARCIGKGNRSFTNLNYLNATIVLSTTPGLDVYQWKRAKDVCCYVHITHAANEVTLYRMFGIDYYDVILVSGDYQISQVRSLEKLRNLPEKEVVKVGIPYMDEMAARLAEVGSAEPHERTVLLAPSWGPGAALCVYGEQLIQALLDTGYHVIVRPHPQSFESEKEMLERLMKKYPDSEQIEWNRDRDNFEVLRRSDILVSDFSGVIFDFSLVYDKPVIYTDPKIDESVYDAWWLEEPLWTYSALPRLGCQLTQENLKDMKSLIDACIDDPRYALGRQEVKAETWAYIGEGAKRTVDYLVRKYEELTCKKEEM